MYVYATLYVQLITVLIIFPIIDDSPIMINENSTLMRTHTLHF